MTEAPTVNGRGLPMRHHALPQEAVAVRTEPNAALAKPAVPKAPAEVACTLCGAVGSLSVSGSLACYGSPRGPHPVYRRPSP